MFELETGTVFCSPHVRCRVGVLQFIQTCRGTFSGIRFSGNVKSLRDQATLGKGNSSTQTIPNGRGDISSQEGKP